MHSKYKKKLTTNHISAGLCCLLSVRINWANWSSFCLDTTEPLIGILSDGFSAKFDVDRHQSAFPRSLNLLLFRYSFMILNFNWLKLWVLFPSLSLSIHKPGMKLKKPQFKLHLFEWCQKILLFSSLTNDGQITLKKNRANVKNEENERTSEIRRKKKSKFKIWMSQVLYAVLFKTILIVHCSHF